MNSGQNNENKILTKRQQTLTALAQARRQSIPEADPMMELKEMISKMDKNINEMDKNINGKLDVMDKKYEQNAKVIKELSEQIKDLTMKQKEIDKSVLDLKTKSNKYEETVKKITNESKEIKKSQEVTNQEIKELKELQESTLDQIALLEMHQRDLILRFRGLPETQDENIEQKLTTELANWLGVQQDELWLDIDKIFRIKYENDKVYKGPGDCLVFFNSRLLKDKILIKRRQTNLIIDDKSVRIMKEIPKRILKKRQSYKELTDALNKNSIRFRWEFPEGITFTFREKKNTIRSAEEATKFWQKNKKKLGGKTPDQE